MKKYTNYFFFLGLGFGLGIAFYRFFLKDQPLPRKVGPWALGWLDRNKSDQELIDDLKASGLLIRQKLMETHPTRLNYRVLNHIIGIERWGRRRLAVALGESLLEDEYNGYRPPLGLSWNELQDQFHQARQETLATAEAIKAHHAGDMRIHHNTYGPLTPAMWLTYLRAHSEGELLKMR